MKKKLLNLMRVFLVAAGLGVGANGAWGQVTTTLYGRAIVADAGNGYSAWTNDDVTTSSSSTAWKASAASVEINATTGLTVPKAAASENATFSGLSPENGCILTYDAVFGFQTGNRNSNNGYIQFGSGIIIYACGQQKKVWMEVNENTVELGTTNANRWDDELTIHMEVNTFTKKITALTVTAVNNSTTINYTSDAAIDVASDATYTSIKIGENRGLSSLQAGAYLKSIRVQQTEQAVSSVNYTVKFQDTDGTTIKDDAVYTNGVIGEVYSAPSTDLNTFYSDDTNKKYVYKSGQNTETVASETASDNVITLVFNTYTKYHYSLTTSAGEQVDTQEGDKYSDETITLYYPVCIKDGSDYYVITKNELAPYYGYTLSAADNTKTINYTVDPDVVYYAEFEDIASQTFSTNWLVGYSSKGASTILQANKSGTAFVKTNMETTSDGVYRVTIASGDRSNRSYSRDWYLIDEGDNTTLLKTYSLTNNQFMTDEIITTIPAGCEIYYLLDNSTNSSSALNDNYAIDYILVRKVESVSATLGTNGYATFASPYALDLTTANLPTGLTAYKAAVSGTTVTFTALNQTVPANTGILLQGEASESYDIPVVASGTTVTENEFLVNEDGTTFPGDDNYYYFGLMKNSLTFGQFAPSTVAIPANKAYLKVLKSSIDESPSRALTIIFGDETTGISEERIVKSENVATAPVYDLQGRRVAQPAKGLYIVNGKKLIIK